MTVQRKTGAGCGAEFTHLWRWKNRLPDRFGQRCRILLERGDFTLWIEFEDGRWDPRRDRPQPDVKQLDLELS